MIITTVNCSFVVSEATESQTEYTEKKKRSNFEGRRLRVPVMANTVAKLSNDRLLSTTDIKGLNPQWIIPIDIIKTPRVHICF